MKTLIIATITVILLLSSANIHSKAFCALRDPVAQIYQLYPQADGYRSLVRTIADDTRQQVKQRLPGHELHADELGRHTLYVAMKNDQPMGIVHVRSEQSRWGLIEIAWAIDLNLNIKDFSFQRSRASGNEIVLKQQFKSLIIGKNFANLSAYIDKYGKVDHQEFKRKAQQAPELSYVVLINGLKTLLITEIAWAAELNEMTAS